MASWLVDTSFPPIVKIAWHGNNWQQAVGKFPSKVQEWNYNCFGNLFQKKRRLMGRMERINKKLTMGGNSHLSKLLRKLWREYNDVLAQEELFWRQKARCDWVKFGDRNTRFFHSTTIIRRKRNKIEALTADDGNIITDVGLLKSMIVSYF